MRWLFEKREESDNEVLYAYSRESHALDGLLKFDKSTEAVSVIQPCATDEVYENASEEALEFLFLLQAEGFPNKKYIACG